MISIGSSFAIRVVLRMDLFFLMIFLLTLETKTDAGDRFWVEYYRQYCFRFFIIINCNLTQQLHPQFYFLIGNNKPLPLLAGSNETGLVPGQTKCWSVFCQSSLKWSLMMFLSSTLYWHIVYFRSWMYEGLTQIILKFDPRIFVSVAVCNF